MTFALDLQKFAEKYKAEANEAVGSIVVRIHGRIDELSPVGDRERWAVNIDRKERGLPPVPKGYIGGRFRGNWQLGIGVIPAGVLERLDPSGDDARGAVLAAIPEEAAGNVFYLANNLPYAQRLEDGYSKVAPAGMVGITVTEFQQIVDAAVSDAKGGNP